MELNAIYKNLHKHEEASEPVVVKRVGVNERGYRVGESHHRSRLSDADVELIFYLRDAGLSFAKIARKFDDGLRISESTVRDVCSGRIRGQAPVAFRKAHNGSKGR